MFRKARRSGGFFFSLLINLCLNFEPFVAAIALLVLHFMVNVSMIFFWIALGLWIIPTFVRTLLLFLIVGAANTYEHRDNKNPHSAGVAKSSQTVNKNPHSYGSVKSDQPANKNPYSKK